jgi:MFS family permease
MTSIAVLLLIRAQTGSFGVAGLAVGAYSIFAAAASPVQGMLVDRLGQRKVLLPCAVGQGAALMLLVLAATLGSSEWLLLLLAALAGALLPPVSACTRALWGQIDEPIRQAAFALDAISQEMIWILGPLVVGLSVALGSPKLAVILAASITVIGSIVFAASPDSRAWRGPDVARSRLGALESGALRVVLGLILLTGVSWGALAVGLPALAVHLGSRTEAGVFVALFSAGSLIGGLTFASRDLGLSFDAHYRLFAALPAVAALPLFFANSLGSAAIFSLLAGLPWAPLMARHFMLVGMTAPHGAITEAFTWSTSALLCGIAGGSALTGPLIDRGGAQMAVAVVCGSGLVAGVLALSFHRPVVATVAPAPAGDR